jgi:hypothetical protein
MACVGDDSGSISTTGVVTREYSAVAMHRGVK